MAALAGFAAAEMTIPKIAIIGVCATRLTMVTLDLADADEALGLAVAWQKAHAGRLQSMTSEATYWVAFKASPRIQLFS